MRLVYRIIDYPACRRYCISLDKSPVRHSGCHLFSGRKTEVQTLDGIACRFGGGTGYRSAGICILQHRVPLRPAVNLLQQRLQVICQISFEMGQSSIDRRLAGTSADSNNSDTGNSGLALARLYPAIHACCHRTTRGRSPFFTYRCLCEG